MQMRTQENGWEDAHTAGANKVDLHWGNGPAHVDMLVTPVWPRSH